MKKEVFDDKAQAAWINQACIPVVVMDRRQETGANPPEIANLQSKYQVHGFPTLVVRYPNNDFKIEVGFANRDNLLQFLHGALASSGGK
jgi:protein-disulfide isomerase-like protein with CxxC motif